MHKTHLSINKNFFSNDYHHFSHSIKNRYLCIWIYSILAVEITALNILKVFWIKNLIDDLKSKFVRAITIATNNNCNHLLFCFRPPSALFQESYYSSYDKIRYSVISLLSFQAHLSNFLLLVENSFNFSLSILTEPLPKNDVRNELHIFIWILPTIHLKNSFRI